MQKTIFAATLAVALGMGGTAYAADLNGGSLKDAPAYLPANTWTGFYLGAGGGAGLSRPLLKYAWQASLVEQPTLPGLGLQSCCSLCA
jgi:hypothetical protein